MRVAAHGQDTMDTREEPIMATEITPPDIDPETLLARLSVATGRD
jgi:hypothetical protein